MKRKSFIRGAAVLAASALVCKALGAIYRIPLGGIIGAEGMGCYQMAYPVYSLLLVISSAGVPIAVSKMVSERYARGDRRGAGDVFRVSLAALAAVGIISAVLLYALSGAAASAMGMPEAAFSLKMLAPALVFVAMVSAFRGYLQGMQLMGATAVSQLAEQLVRLTLGLSIARAWIGRGAQYGAGGALLGVTISEVIGLIVILLYYLIKKKEFGMVRSRIPAEESRSILSELWRLALPVTVGACAAAIVGAIDSGVIMRVLTAEGYARERASELFGLLSGFVQPIVNLPAVLSASVAISIVPAISASVVRGNAEHAKKQADLAFKLAVILGAACSVGLFILAEPLMSAIFGSLSAEEAASAGELMRIIAPSVLCMTVAQITTGLLQSVGHTSYPVLSLLIGTAVKLFLGVWLIRIPALNIKGAAIGTVVCFALTAGINTLLTVKYAGIRLKAGVLIRPLTAAAGMGAVVLAVKNAVPGSAGVWAAVLAGAAVYAILLILTGAIGKEELEGLPCWGRAARLLRRFGIWRNT